MGDDTTAESGVQVRCRFVDGTNAWEAVGRTLSSVENRVKFDSGYLAETGNIVFVGKGIHFGMQNKNGWSCSTRMGFRISAGVDVCNHPFNEMQSVMCQVNCACLIFLTPMKISSNTNMNRIASAGLLPPTLEPPEHKVLRTIDCAKMTTLWTANLLSPQTMVKSDKSPLSRKLQGPWDFKSYKEDGKQRILLAEAFGKRRSLRWRHSRCCACDCCDLSRWLRLERSEHWMNWLIKEEDKKRSRRLLYVSCQKRQKSNRKP